MCNGQYRAVFSACVMAEMAANFSLRVMHHCKNLTFFVCVELYGISPDKQMSGNTLPTAMLIISSFVLM